MRALLGFVAYSGMVGCSPPEPKPAATMVEWTIVKTADRKGYHLTGRAVFAANLPGWYQPTITLLDDKGCNRGVEISETQVISHSGPGLIAATFDHVVPVARPVATATFDIRYEELAGGKVVRTPLYNQVRVVDARVRPPANPVDACGNIARGDTPEAKRAKLRERARSNPEGADAEAIGGMSRNELVATAINSAGYLCARVTDMYPRGTGVVAHCVEYRSGKGRVSYFVDPAASTVQPLH